MFCPTCKKPIPDPAPGQELPKYFPFCSERCKLIDLGAWAAEKHAIPGEVIETEDRAKPGDDET